MPKELPAWSRLDNVGKLFPSVQGPRLTNLFRIAVDFAAPLSRGLVQEALENLAPRFPWFWVRLKAGVFWYALIEQPNHHPRVLADGAFPQMPLKAEAETGHLFRVRVQRQRLALEMNHSLTDGTGALIFLQALVHEYLRLKGVPVPADAYSPGSAPDPEEGVDAFHAQRRKGLPHPPGPPRAWHVPGRLLPRGCFYVTHGHLSLASVKEKAKDAGVSITEWLAAVYLEELQALDLADKPRRRGPLRLICPVNLRKLYTSKTLRNFFLSVYLEVDPRLGPYSFEALLKKVHHQMQWTVDEHLLRQVINFNLRGETLPLIRSLPLVLKNQVLRTIYKDGETRNTSSLSNLGRVDLDETARAHVTGVSFIPLPSPYMKIAAGLVSFGDRLTLSFGRMIRHPEVERRVFTALRRRGLAVRVESNYRPGREP